MQTFAATSVLLVDDSSVQRHVVKEMLIQLGFRAVEEADDGRTALAKLRTRSYSLIICDWHMEPMDGSELLREVCRMRTPNNGRFIMITTEGTWGRQTTSRLDGADAFLAKPFGIDALKAKIDLVLARNPGRSYQRA